MEEFVEENDGPEPEWMPPEQPPPVRDLKDLSEDPLRHIYLFAKGHYVRTYDFKLGMPEPMLCDVIRIIERAYGLKEVSTDDVFKILLPAVWDSIHGLLDFQEMFLFLRTQLLNIEKQQELTLIGADEALCKMCLVILGIRVTAEELILGMPDANILTPMSVNQKNYRRKNNG
jgi:hypothetical protein